MINKAAHNYALALSQVKGVDLKKAEDDLHTVRNTLREDARFTIFLESPSISTEAKKKALVGAFSGKIQKSVLDVILILTQKRITALIADIFSAYRKVLDQLLGRTYIDVAVAKDISGNGGIDDQLRDSIIKKVDTNRAAFGLVAGKELTYDISVKVDPALLAGVRVRVADYIFDGTVARNLIHWHDVAVVHPLDMSKAFSE
jgi:F-type H+-transporting ATPase subunit delta